MCSPGSAKKATQTASDSLVSNVKIYGATGGKARLAPYGFSKPLPMNEAIAQQKAAATRYVAVEDRGQFQYTDNKSGDIVKTPELEKQLKAKEATLNITNAPYTGGNTLGYGNQTTTTTSYVVPAQLKIKRNWSVSGPGGVGIPSMNVNEATSFARTDQSARTPDVLIRSRLRTEGIVGGGRKIIFKK